MCTIICVNICSNKYRINIHTHNTYAAARDVFQYVVRPLLLIIVSTTSKKLFCRVNLWLCYLKITILWVTERNKIINI